MPAGANGPCAVATVSAVAGDPAFAIVDALAVEKSNILYYQTIGLQPSDWK
jgi:hypothetical protein